jgi:hypothetical protein
MNLSNFIRFRGYLHCVQYLNECEVNGFLGE